MIDIRPATLEDVATIVDIHIRSWRAQFESLLSTEQVKLKDLDEANQRKKWQGRLSGDCGDTHITLVASNSDRDVGYVYGGQVDGHYDAELHQIYVLPDAHGYGIGTQLVRELARELRQFDMQSLMVWVMTINPAIAFYRDHLGGTFIEERIIPHGDGVLREAMYAWPDIQGLAR